MAFVAPYAQEFETAVHGTVFGSRTAVVHRLRAGDPVILVPDPAGAEVPAVWVHAPGGDVVGHLPVHIAAWMAPWMLAGTRCGGVVASVASDDVASWRRLVIEVKCRGPVTPPPVSPPPS